MPSRLRRALIASVAAAALAGLAPLTAANAAVAPCPVAPKTSPNSGAVQFGPTGTLLCSGYQLNTGKAFNGTSGFETLTGKPIDATKNIRKRGDVGLVHLDYRGAAATGLPQTPLRFQQKVKPGWYLVSVLVGDPNFFDSRHVIRAEGHHIMETAPGSDNGPGIYPLHNSSRLVKVTDGFLTLDQEGGKEPAYPRGENTKLISMSYDFVGAGNEVVNEKFDFTPRGTPAAPGYRADLGEAYNDARGYGWLGYPSNTSYDIVPVDVSQHMRKRNATSDQRFDSLMHLSPANSHGNPRWQMKAAPGTYKVTVGVGDPSYTDSKHLISAGHQTIGERFVPTASNKTATVTDTVQVLENGLTIQQYGSKYLSGSNTKIAFIEVERVGDLPNDRAY